MNSSKKKASQKKTMRKHSLRNFFIVIIAIIAVIYCVEGFIALLLPSKTTDKVNPVLFNFEKSSIEDLSTTLMTRAMFELPDKYNGNYPLIDLSAENEYNDDTVNIVVFGDSFVWGHGSLNRNELFWPIVEKELRAKGYNCRVYGIGMAGASAFEEYDWLTKSSLVKDIDPDIVIFGYVANDWFPGDRGFDPYAYSSSSPILSVLSKLTPHIFSCLYLMPTSGTLKYAEENFVAPLNEYAKAADFPIVYMTLPDQSKILKYLYKPLHKLFSEYTDVAFYDPLYEFRHDFMSKEHSKNYTVNPADEHPGSAINRFYAEYIVRFLENDYSDVLGNSEGTDLNNYEININEWMPYRLNIEKVNKTDNSAVYTLNYPSASDNYTWEISTRNFFFNKYLLNYPLGQDHIKLSFAEPVDIKSIEITGDKVENIDLYCTLLNEKLGYDDHEIIPFGTKLTDGKTWTDDSNEKVMSLCIHADCVNQDGSKLQIVINK